MQFKQVSTAARPTEVQIHCALPAQAYGVRVRRDEGTGVDQLTLIILMMAAQAGLHSAGKLPGI